MNDEPVSQEAQALDAFLDSQVADLEHLPPEMAQAAIDLLSFSQHAKPGAGFTANLRLNLLHQYPGLRKMNPFNSLFKEPKMFKNISLSLAGAAIVIIVVLFGLPLLRSSQLAPASTHIPASVLPAPIHTPTPLPVELPLLSFLNVPAAQAASGAGSFFGEAPVTLNASFPATPAEVTIYALHSFEPLTLENARQMADQLGIHGGIYQSQGEDSRATLYTITDGDGRVTFLDTPTIFSYVAHYPNVLSSPGAPLPFEQRVAVAEEFLKSHGLLDFEYRVTQGFSSANLVVFTRLLDGIPLLDNKFQARIQVEVDDSGQVKTILYQVNKLETVGQYPIRTAQDAWQILLASKSDARTQFNVIFTNPPAGGAQPFIPQSWLRSLPTGQRADLYGYPEVLQPAEAGGLPLVTIDNLMLKGSLDDLIQSAANPGELSDAQKQQVQSGEVSENEAIGWAGFYHVWGQMGQLETGAPYLVLEGWEKSLQPDEVLDGRLQNQDGQKRLLTADGQSWTLSDLPADVPENIRLNVRGVRLADQPGAFYWTSVFTVPEVRGGWSGGGGGGGGMSFSPNPDETSAPTPPPALFQPGDRIDGVTGHLYVIIWEAKDGSRRMEYTLTTFSSDPSQPSYSYSLTGEGVKGIEQYYNLTVRIWGTYLDENGTPTIQVERYEKANPDEHIQAWLGKNSVVTLEGRKALLFTSIEGQQFVLYSSLINPEDMVVDGFNGEQYVLEGIFPPDRTFGGYPVVSELSVAIAPGRSNLEGYQIQSNTPGVLPGSDVQGSPVGQGPIVVDQIELGYYMSDFQGSAVLDIDQSPERYVQPVWVFKGHSSDGGEFEIKVQAVQDQYLK